MSLEEKEADEKKSIEIILESIKDTIKIISGGNEPAVEERGDYASIIQVDHYTIIMGIMGQFEGQIIFSFNENFVANVANVMTGQEFKEIDELAFSAVIEFANMISGAATIKLVDYYDTEKITMAPPVLVKGLDMSVLSKVKIVKGYKISMELGELHVRIALIALS